LLKRFFFTLLAFIVTSNLSLSFAAAPRDTDVEISTPIGGDILPGGTFRGEDFKDGILFSRIIPFLIKYTINLTVAISVAVLIYAGYLYITAYGDSDKHAKAQKTITYALIGLVVSITAYGIVTIITNINFS